MPGSEEAWMSTTLVAIFVTEQRRGVGLSTGKPVLEGSTCEKNNWINFGIPGALSSIKSLASHFQRVSLARGRGGSGRVAGKKGSKGVSALRLKPSLQ